MDENEKDWDQRKNYELFEVDWLLFFLELSGYDFMLDERPEVWLIEANTNPCTELASPLLARLIPTMLKNALKMAVDPLLKQFSLPLIFERPSTRSPVKAVLGI